MLVGRRAGELVLDSETRGACDTRGRHRGQLDGCDAHLRRGDYRLDPVRVGPSIGTVPAAARADARRIEETPRVGALRRRGRGETHAQRSHPRGVDGIMAP